MGWIKKGLIFQPDRDLYWQKSHAALPTSLHVKDDLYRIYFTSRDGANKTYVGFFDLELGQQDFKIINKSREPVLTPGALGLFDQDGVQCTSVVRVGEKVYMYYLGWSRGLPEPLFFASIGVAISSDGGLTFEKYSEAPIMERSRYDPWMVSGGTVLFEKKCWRMWYISGIDFELTAQGAKSKYDIKYAESVDGLNWRRNGISCIPLRSNETNISRLSIIKELGVYKAWFPYKSDGNNYRIGYAESTDGINWHRADERASIDVSESGWDSKALDKVWVLNAKGMKFMLYNGNNFGYDGIGLAVES